MTVLYRMGDMGESEASVVGIANRTTDSAPGVRRGLREEGRVHFALQKRDSNLHMQSTGAPWRTMAPPAD